MSSKGRKLSSGSINERKSISQASNEQQNRSKEQLANVNPAYVASNLPFKQDIIRTAMTNSKLRQ